MQKIVPHLWFDKEAKEAAEFYVSTFGDGSRVKSVKTIHDTPSGDCDIVSFDISGFSFMAISAGPYFKPTPAISFMVNFDPSQVSDAKQRIDAVWAKLAEGGKVLMPLDKYPFSERYGWVEDKYGFSWQLILTNPEGEERPPIIPSLLFVTDECEAAEKATDFYLSVFSAKGGKNSKRGALMRYPAGMGDNKEGSVMFTDFKLEGQWFAAMDGSSQMHKFNFNEAVSLIVNCDTQEEIDYYWEKLSADPAAEQCGWLKDKYGVSWQIVPDMGKWLEGPDTEGSRRATQAMLKMKKIDIQGLQDAYAGK